MFQSVGKVINLKTTPGLSRSLQAAVVLGKVNDGSAGRWQAIRFRLGRLTLVAPSAIEAQELQLARERILQEINGMFEVPIVKQIIIRS